MSAALAAGAVVGEQHDDGVVEKRLLPQEVQQPSDLGIGVFHESGEGLLHPRAELALLRGKAVPGRYPWVARCQPRFRRDDAETDLLVEHPDAFDVPALVEHSAITLNELPGRLVRGVARAEGQVGEKGTAGIGRDVVADELLGPVDEIFAEVIAVPGRRIHAVLVVPEFGCPLVVLAPQESIPAVETAAGGPLMERPRRTHLRGPGQMPLAQRVGPVPARAEHLGQGARRRRHRAPSVGVAGVEIREETHAHRVVVAPGEQAGTRCRTQRCRMEVRVAQPRVR